MKKRLLSPSRLVVILLLALMQAGTARGQDAPQPEPASAHRLDMVMQMGGPVTDSIPLPDGSMLAAQGSALIRVSGGYGLPQVTARADLGRGIILDLAVAEPWILALTESGLSVLPQESEHIPPLISFVPGGGQAMSISGSMVAVASQEVGLRLLMLKADGTLNPLSEIAFTAPGGSAALALDVTLAADTRLAYVAAGLAGVQVVDISDPEAPLPLGPLPEPYPAEALTMMGKLLVVGSEGRVVIVDPAPGAGRVGLYAPIRQARRVVVHDEYAYIADALDGVKILWLAAADRPVLVYSEAGRPAMDLELIGTTLFVAGMDGLRILDVSSRYRPLEVARTFLPGLSEGLALDTAPEGVPERVFLASGEDGIAIFDVRNLSSPQITGRIRLEGSARSVHFSGRTLYAAMGEAGLAVIDARVPGAETLVSTMALPGRTLDLERRGNALYVAAGDAGVLALDTTRAHTPVLASVLPLEPLRAGSDTLPREAQSIMISGKRAYVSDGDGLLVLDVSRTDRLGRLARINTPAAHAASSGIYLYTVSGAAVNIYDARATAEPIFLRTYRGLEQIAHLEVQGSILFATSAGPGPDAVTINLTAPDAPSEMDSIGSVGETERMTPTHGEVWLSAGFAGLRRYGVSEGGALIPRGQYTPIAETGALATDYATLLAGGRNGWSALNVPTGLSVVAGDASQRNIIGLEVKGDLAAVVSGSDLALYNLSAPDAPRLIASHDTQGAAAVALDERQVYVAEAAGLTIFDQQYLLPIARITTPSPPVDLVLRGSLIYLALEDGKLAVVELGDPTGGIILRRSLATRRPTRLIAGPDSSVYGLADNLLSRLYVSDVQQLGVIEDGTLPLIAPQGFFIDDGTFATFVPGETLRFYDVQRLNQGPMWHSAVDMSLDASPAEAVAVKGRIVYAAYGDAGLGIIDRLATNARAVLHDEPVSALLLTGDRLFAAGSSLSVWDVATPQAPVLIASLPLTAPARHINLTAGDHLLISTGNGVSIIDWDGASLVTVGHLAGPAVDQAAQIDSRLYAALHQGGLLVADASDPAQPEALFTYLSPSGQFVTDLLPLTSGHLLVSWEGGIDALDVSSPAPSPHLLNVIETGEAQPSDLALSTDAGRMVMALGEDGAAVLELSDPANPAPLGHVDTPGEGHGAALNGSELYIADGVCGLRVFDVSNPASMQETAVWRGGYAGSVALGVETIYVGGGNQLYELRFDPSAPPASPPAPQHPDPLNGSSGVSLDAALRWEPPADPCDPLTYNVFFGVADNPPLVGQVIGEPVLSIGNLDPLRTYHWHVESIDSQGNRTMGPDWRFTTMRGEFPDTLPPAPPIFIEQVRQHPAVPIGLTAVFLLVAISTGIYWRMHRYSELEQEVPSWYSTTGEDEEQQETESQ